MPRVDALVPQPGETVDLEGSALEDWLAARYAIEGSRWVRLELVTALDGRLTGGDGTSEGLTGGIDRTVLRVLRRSADAVLVGAGSLRAERIPMPRAAVLAVATLSGRVDPERLPAPEGGRRPLVLCPADAAPRVAGELGSRAEVLPVGGDVRASPALLIDVLADRGLGRVVCEGGAALAGALLRAGVVDELDQTVAPVLSPEGPVLSPPAGSARLVGLLHDETDRLYGRWALAPR